MIMLMKMVMMVLLPGPVLAGPEFRPEHFLKVADERIAFRFVQRVQIVLPSQDRWQFMNVGNA